MSKLDPQLAFLQETGAIDLDPLEAQILFGIESGDQEAGREAESSDPEIQVLVQHSGDPSDLEQAGLTIRSINGDVISGLVAISNLTQLAAIAEVERVESAHPMFPELDLSLAECRANVVHTGPPGRRGAGVIVGIVDSGTDFTHPSFRNSDGSSRILFLWDQGLARTAGETSPSPFGYGVEYSKAQIDAALATASPTTTVRHTDPGSHGTHVAGIAAGDGSEPGNGQPAFTYIGVAPEADLIVVANRSSGAEGLGTSANTLDAVNYIFTKAQSLAKPAVVNMSLGDNLGPHDGTSLLERGLNNLLGAQGRAFVKSAGNAANQGVHARGTVGTGVTTDVTYNQPAGNPNSTQIDLWYRGADVFRLSVVAPGGTVMGPVNVGVAQTFTAPGGNTVRIDHRNNDPFNGDKRGFITIRSGTATNLTTGTWTLRIQSVSSAGAGGGTFDAWIQRTPPGIPAASFLAPFRDETRTISTPGTFSQVITAANYITRGPGPGSLANSSSRGPTRDGRAAPTLAAPGSGIISARAGSGGGNPYVSFSGTSMAAPHITGTIALMLQKNPNRTQLQLRDCLTSTARNDAQTGPVPNTAWGAGKMDAAAAVNCVPSPVVFPPPPTFISICFRPTVLTSDCFRPTVLTSSCFRTVLPPCGGAPTRLGGCPSVVDGCPSTPGGCGFNPINPNPVINPVVTPRLEPVGGNVLAPGGTLAGAAGARLSNLAIAAQALADAATALNQVAAEMLPADTSGVDPSEQDAAAQADPLRSSEQLPPEGYYEYDESWFDQ